jgi:hypothetical protein
VSYWEAGGATKEAGADEAWSKGARARELAKEATALGAAFGHLTSHPPPVFHYSRREHT